MLGIVSEDENHNKIFKPMAGATLGQGVPLGTWCSFEKDVAPSSNWLMAGTTFDATVYPALNLYLGTNVVPSRYDHSRLGDTEQLYELQNVTQENFTCQYDGIIEAVVTVRGSGAYIASEIEVTRNGVSKTFQIAMTTVTNTVTIPVIKGDSVTVKVTAVNGTRKLQILAQWYTHPLFIKATSIASDSDQQSILAQIQAYNTYSTEETLTGKTWIDGKPIYRVVRHTVINSQLAQGYTSSNSIMTGAFTTNAETVVDIFALSYTTAGGWSKLYTTGGGGARAIAWRTDSTIYNNAGDTIPNEQYIVIEYTKTTD